MNARGLALAVLLLSSSVLVLASPAAATTGLCNTTTHERPGSSTMTENCVVATGTKEDKVCVGYTRTIVHNETGRYEDTECQRGI